MGTLEDISAGINSIVNYINYLISFGNYFNVITNSITDYILVLANLGGILVNLLFLPFEIFNFFTNIVLFIYGFLPILLILILIIGFFIFAWFARKEGLMSGFSHSGNYFILLGKGAFFIGDYLLQYIIKILQLIKIG